MNEPQRPTPAVPDNPFLRFDARVLDPTTAVRPPDGTIPATTAYVGDTLLVTASSLDEAEGIVTELDTAGRDSVGLRVVESPVGRWSDVADGRWPDRASRIREAAAAGVSLTVPVRFAAVDEKAPAPAPDVWPLLQALHTRGFGADRVGLDHLMFSAASISGNPVYAKGLALILGDPVYAKGLASVAGNPVYAKGLADARVAYAVAGSGGRGPVSVVMPPPVGRGTGAPSVVVLDTGVGGHPWFTASPVATRPTTPNGSVIGLDPADPAAVDSDPEGAGGVPDPMTGVLASHAGHGTFIAGLLRQACPNAVISAVRVMDADGVVPENVLAQALQDLALSVVSGWTLDAVVLSLGYYPETGDDLAYTAGLRHHLVDLATAGATVFCAAGNDSTIEPSFPAAFAADPTWPQGAPRVVSVAALNPDGSVALFSNDGVWVSAEAPGANLVSTVPTGQDGAGGESIGTYDDLGRRRATIDPDDYSSGFATWSGTSFAAPVAAGRYLAALVDAGMPGDPAERWKLVSRRHP